MIGPINFGGAFVYDAANGQRERTPVSALDRAAGEAPQDRARLRQRVVSLRRLLERFQTELNTSRASVRGRVAIARSSADLGLDAVATPTTLTSTEEVNTTPTSFSPFGPSFEGDSESLPTVGGVYDGSDGTDTLTFSISRNETIGSNTRSIKVEVRNGAGSKIDQFQIRPGTAADTPFTLENGLTVEFSAGEVVKKDVFTVDVFADVGSAVDPNQPFDGSRNQNPNLEPGQSVVAGAFQINGVTIAVNSSDSLQQVLDRITASSAGVSAAFNPATETVRLTQKSIGESHDIVVGSDSSGFFEATKLAVAVAVPGQAGDAANELLANVPQLAGITSGTATINGVDITVDVDADTLTDLLTRINASGAGVTAALNDERLTIMSADTKQAITLDDGTTGLFSTLLIDPGTYAGREGKTGFSSNRITGLLRGIAAGFRRLFRTNPGSSRLAELRSALNDATQNALGTDRSVVRTDYGLRFDLRDSSRGLLDLDDGGIATLRNALRQRPGEVRRQLLEPRRSGEEGLLPRLIEELESAEQELRSATGGIGVLLDRLA